MSREPQRSDAWTGFGTAWNVIAQLLSGMVVWGLAGFGIDRLVGTEKLFLAIGLVVGAGTGIYLVYLKYGREDHET